MRRKVPDRGMSSFENAKPAVAETVTVIAA